jgi:Zn finger protein HypA/HybF involved in hydrogenase expression
VTIFKFTEIDLIGMIDVKDLKVCSDCGTVYHGKFSRDVCPNCHTNNFEQVSADSGMGSLEQ